MSCCRTRRGWPATSTTPLRCWQPCAPRPGTRTLKVIIESGELPDPAAIDRAAHFAIAAGADFVKTSTGKTPDLGDARRRRDHPGGDRRSPADRSGSRHRAGSARSPTPAPTSTSRRTDDGRRLGDAGHVPLRRQQPPRRPRVRPARPRPPPDHPGVRPQTLGWGQPGWVRRRGSRHAAGLVSGRTPSSTTTSMIDRRSSTARWTSLAGRGVADDRVERGGDGGRPLGVAAAALLVGRDAGDAPLGEQAAHVGEQRPRLEQRVGHHRQVRVELEDALRRAERDRRVVAEHPRPRPGSPTRTAPG